jgi:hypothetical protein
MELEFKTVKVSYAKDTLVIVVGYKDMIYVCSIVLTPVGGKNQNVNDVRGKKEIESCR